MYRIIKAVDMKLISYISINQIDKMEMCASDCLHLL